MTATLDGVALRFVLPEGTPHAEIPRVGDVLTVKVRHPNGRWEMECTVDKLVERGKPLQATVTAARIGKS